MTNHKLLASLLWIGLLMAEDGRTTATAQEHGTERRTAQKFDEYGRVGSCDHSARLDNLAVELQNNSSLQAYVITYHPRSSDRAARHRLEYAKHYLTVSRGIDAARIITIEGGEHDVDELKTELWVAPTDALPPFEAPPATVALTDAVGKIDEYVTDDRTPHHEADTNGVSFVSDISFRKLAERLQGDTALQGFIVVFTEDKDLPGTWRRIARREQRIIGEMYKIEPQRLTAIHGGRSEKTKVELWVLPDGESPPVQKNVTENTRVEAYWLASLSVYEGDSLSEDTDEWQRENFADALKHDEQATGVLIHRAPSTAALAESEDSQEPPDVRRLAEKWRRMIVKQYGVRAYRLIILQGAPSEGESGELEMWIVPRGAPLPDVHNLPSNEETGEAQ